MIKKIAFLTLFAALIIADSTVLAIGQMSEPIVVNDALKGQEIKDTISVTNSEDRVLEVKIQAEGQIVDWTTFYAIEDKELANPITELTLPARGSAKAIVLLRVPDDAPNGTYKGVIAAISKLTEKTQSSANDGTANVLQKIDREVTITVSGKEIVKLEAAVLPLTYGIPAGQKLQVKAIYDNQGNVAVKPDLQLKITNADATSVLHNAIYPYPDNESAVKALERREFPNMIEWQTTGQPEGKYQAFVKVMLDGDVIKEENFQFDIISAQAAAAVMGANTSNPAFGDEKNQMPMWYILAGIAGAAVVLATIALFGKRKKNQVVDNR